MALSIDWATRVISIPQSDLTLITGSLYELDTNAFRLEILSILGDEVGMPFPRAINHNTEVTIAGTVYARLFSIINGWSVEFTPDSQWTVRLTGSNNDMFDVENGILIQNQVQVIPNNSAGLQTVSSGSGLSTPQDDRLREIWQRLALDDATPVVHTDGSITIGSITITITESGGGTTTTAERA